MVVDTMVGSLFQHHNIHAVGMPKTLRPHPPALIHESFTQPLGPTVLLEMETQLTRYASTYFTSHLVLNDTLDRYLQRRGASRAS